MNVDRRIGAWIFLGAGITVLFPSILPAWEEAPQIVKEFELWKALWCLGWVFIGFAFNGSKASQNKQKITTGAWPLYLFTYLPFLVIAAVFIYFAVDVYTFDRKHYFHCMALFIAFFVGYDVDRVINRPHKFFRDSGANTSGP